MPRQDPKPRRRSAKTSPGDRVEIKHSVFMLTREAVRELDRLATEKYRIPSIVLMENAARHVAEVALSMIERETEPTVAVFAGPGNNGGDGFAAARHLHNAGVKVRIVLAAPRDRYQADAGANLAIAERMAIPITGPGDASAPGLSVAPAASDGSPTLVIDALLGTGLDRPVSGAMAGLVGTINELGRGGSRVLSVDLPSGLDTDKGEPLGVAVRADVTVTFAGPKPGLCRLEAQPYVGEVVIADIGAPRELTEQLGTAMPEVPPDHVS